MQIETFKQYSPTVVYALDRALLNINHAYLFYGPEGSPLDEIAYTFASCILSNETSLHEAKSYQRVIHHNHLDLIVSDGKESVISKEAMDNLIHQVILKPIEANVNNRVALLLNMDNATTSAQNALLKTLEEPGEHVVFILTCHSLSKVLETIISRCNLIPFQPLKDSYYYALASSVASKEDAYFLSKIFHVEDYQGYVDSSVYKNAMMMFKDTFTQDFKELLTNYDISYKQSEKSDNLEMIKAYLQLVSIYCHDKLLHIDTDIPFYKDILSKRSETYCMKMLVVVGELMMKVSKYRDQTLMMAEIYQKVEGVHE